MIGGGLYHHDMSNEFGVDVQGLRDAGMRMGQLGAQLAGRQGAINAQVAGSPAIWGADEEGAAFGSAYAEITSGFAELLDAMAGAIDVVGANLGVTADNFDAADAATAEGIAGIGRRLDGRG